MITLALDAVKLKVAWWFKFFGVRDSNDAKLMAIEKAITLCTSNLILHSREIVIVNDSKVVVSWINDDGFGNLNYIDTVYDICSNLEFLGGTVVSFSPRSMNSYADNLAKLGSSLAGGFITWDAT
ncbi:hypothetical protein Q3G72_020344 [Acer saccharum]|nr:hypothetical protein Q3G72_020344 [Acer saccharum]